MEHYNHLSPTFRHYLRKFVNRYFNGSLLDALEEGNRWRHVDYRQLLIKEASMVEQALLFMQITLNLTEKVK